MKSRPRIAHPEYVRLGIVPASITQVKRYIGRHHRHNKAPVGGLFAAGIADDSGELRGVVIAGRPSARPLDDGFTIEVTRVGTDGVRNGCSMLYATIIRAAKALGYRRAYTYTLASESGASLRAAGWVIDAELKPRPTWSCPARHRVQVDIFGEETRPSEAKVRWIKVIIRETFAT
jgi:hypothetical protein